MKQNKIPRNEYIRKPVGKTNPYKEDTIYTDMGQWKYPGQVTKIPSGDITMQGVPYPVYGEDNLGYSQMMYPGMDYQFPGQYVTEYPQMQIGGLLKKGLKAAKEAVKNTYKINPWAEKLKNPNSSYRVAGLDAYDDFKNTGILRSVTPEAPKGASLKERAMYRPTAFPSFQKGYADLNYLPDKGGVIFKTDLPTFKRGDINPVTGFPIKGRHYAHRVIDPKTGAAINDIPASNIEVYSSEPHWLRGYSKKAYGGGLLNKTLTCPSCGWSWKAVDGGKDIATCHKCGGTAKLAYGGDPSLPNIEDHYPFGGQNSKTGTHFQEGGWLDELQKGGRTPIVVDDKNNPKFKSYTDSLALYNLSQKAKKLFDVDPMDPTLEGYNKKANALASKSKIKPTKLQLSGYSQDYPKNFDPGAMEEPWMVTYKKPVQPYILKSEDRHLMTGEDWQDVNSNDYGAEEAKIRSADPEKFDIYRLPNNKFELVPKTKKPSQTLKKTLTSIKKKELSPIIVNDPNDPRLKAYDDSLGLYKSTDYLLSHPLTGDYVPGKEYFKNSKINTDNDNKRIGVKEDLHTGYVNLYKKPVQPYVYEEPIKEQSKKAEPKKAEAKKDYATRNVDFSSPYGPVMKYYDESSKVIRTEPYVLPQQKNGGWLDQYQEAGQLRAATTYQGAHQNPVAYEQKVNAKVKQIDDKLKTSDKAFVIYDGTLYNNPYADPERNEFSMLDKSGSYVPSGIDPFTAFLSAPQQVIKTVSTTLPKAVKAVGEKFKSLKGLPKGAKAVENFKKVMGDLDIDKVISLSQHEKDIALNRENLIKAAISGNQEEFTKAQNTMNHLMAQLADQTKNTGDIGGKLGTAKDVARMKDLKAYGLKTEFLPTVYQRKLDTDLIKYNNEYGTSFFVRNPNPTEADKFTGYTDVPGFNQDLNVLKSQAEFGKKQMLTKDQFFNQTDINNMVKQENNYYKALEEFENANPQSGSDMIMQAFTGDKSYMERFKNLYPNVSLPNWGAKFIPEYEASQLLNKRWSNKNNPLGRYLGKGSPMDKLTDAGKELRRQLDKDWHIRDPKGYLKEMRGSMNLSKMSDAEIAKEAKKVQDALNTQYIERYKKDIEKPFRGIDAFQQLTPNKYGGQQRGWLDELDEEYRRGGQRRRRGTSKNIESSINDVFRRNYNVFGPAGKSRFNPRARYEEGGDLPEAQKGINHSESTFVRKPIVNIKKPNRQPTADDLAWYSMMAAQERQPDVLQQKQVQGKGSKAWDIMMNPFTASGHLYQHGSIPDNFTEGPTSPLDIAPQFVNPAFYAEALYNVGKVAVNPQTYKDMAKTAQGLGMKAMGKEGPEGWQEAGFNTLGNALDVAFALPGIKMAKKAKSNIIKYIDKAGKDVKKEIGKSMRNYNPRSASPPTNFKTGGWLDKYNNF